MEEFIKPVEPSNSSEELLSKEDRQTLRNERLLEACSRDDTERALQLLDEGADCCTEDDKQWTPLQWAATNGNMPLVRKLLAGGAANMYYSPQYGVVIGRLTRLSQKSPPEWRAAEAEEVHALVSWDRGMRCPSELRRVDWSLTGEEGKVSTAELLAVFCLSGVPARHWAAFKGHLKIVWLLLKAGLSPHVKDVLGNTVLHQGSKLILEAASTATQCKDSGEHFSYKVMRYMCSFSEGFFARKAVKMFWVYNTAEDDERECPVTWSAETIRLNKQAEDRIHQALESGSLDEIDAALMLTADHPVCPKLQKRISQEKSKLEGKIALSEAMDVRALVTDDDFYSAIDRLKAAIQIAVEKNCDEAVLNAAQRELKKLEIELRITKLVKKPSYDAFTPNSKFLKCVTHTSAFPCLQFGVARSCWLSQVRHIGRIRRHCGWPPRYRVSKAGPSEKTAPRAPHNNSKTSDSPGWYNACSALDEAIETAREASANPVLLNNAIETRQRTLDYM
ncbi:ankyrin repeat-containing protein [Cystoisospora suis]|uniref:Ankyrin repeat-containing protein n=1 Tax=Cystoisospora suis TaxID=483139 RepID=A0A2C6KRU2_9APIC|nr:ankyrin repeat-containing protein [Cystoisospora suis]